LEGDTIAAISTPLGQSGIGIVRLSGPDAVRIADGYFRGRVPLSRAKPRRLYYGRFVEDGEEVDEVLVSVMRAPHSYTTEDVVEINCHGGGAVTRRILRALLKGGARLAERGEFTKRAFLGGRIDLAQAEAVIDLINAKTDGERRAAYFQLKGKLSGELSKLRDSLIRSLSLLEASLDFPEEDIPIDVREIEGALSEVLGGISSLIGTYSTGRYLRDGAKAVLVGKVNVGKSSLMNALLGEDRAIVTAVPGTTRDALEEWLDIDGMAVRLIDTAGLRKTGDVVEVEGRKRTVMHLREADLVLAVVDASGPLDEEDLEVGRHISGRRKIIVLNKCDLGVAVDRGRVRRVFGEGRIVEVSALTGGGTDELRSAIVDELLGDRGGGSEGVMVTRERHADCLRKARSYLESSISALRRGLPLECVASDVREAASSLGEILGETTPEDILDRIFSEFCVGK